MNTYQERVNEINTKRQNGQAKAEQLASLIQQRDEQAAAQLEHLDTAGLPASRTK